ncbi:S8 family peptidase [Acinetobacter haemolyticus]|uniref:S8 family peptidase n=1 Tax=Acinetobacter haemolyticus TaxID=29430 RepID=UPI000DE89227|nr:S8 family peptidase [Acinetobacter haemolyticus]MCU4377017.1 S8 family peptidase [Acinetobacter haemolyticus]WHR57367.1 S8 family peptidase [Acinetobacter haemolyticus]
MNIQQPLFALIFTTCASFTFAAPTTPSSKHGPIKDQYIVTFNKAQTSSKDLAATLAKSHGGKVLHTYESVLKGFAISLPSNAGQAFVEAMKKNPNVLSVEPDTVMSIHSNVQNNAVWGLDRTDQKNLPLDSNYSYTQTGAGVTAYIVDTGILTSHQQFSGRVKSGYTAISDGKGTTDCNGHGTHVAGTVGGTTYGIAKDVTLVPIRVLGCDGAGTSSGVLAGLDWVVQNGKKPAVVNMSLSGGVSSSLDNAIVTLYDQGYTPVVAAGNSNTDACNSSPARASKAITVAAIDNTDTRANFSNYGSCVDIFAPGTQITSAWYDSNTATKLSNGTSMATPHVAGVVAGMLQSTPTASPQTITTNLLKLATTNIVKDPAGSPNRLLYKAP